MTYATPRLRTERESVCDRCGGSGIGDREENQNCPCCYGLGVGHEYSAPTAADLLTDPRVAALVAALRRVQGDYTIEEEEWRCVDEALTPFGEGGTP